MEDSHLHAHDFYRDHEIRVRAYRNQRQAWVAEVEIFDRDGERSSLPVPELLAPEWLTSGEALRAGIEQGQRILRTRDK